MGWKGKLWSRKDQDTTTYIFWSKIRVHKIITDKKPWFLKWEKPGRGVKKPIFGSWRECDFDFLWFPCFYLLSSGAEFTPITIWCQMKYACEKMSNEIWNKRTKVNLSFIRFIYKGYRLQMHIWLISQSENRRKISQSCRTQVIFWKLTPI